MLPRRAEVQRPRTHHPLGCQSAKPAYGPGSELQHRELWPGVRVIRFNSRSESQSQVTFGIEEWWHIGFRHIWKGPWSVMALRAKNVAEAQIWKGMIMVYSSKCFGWWASDGILGQVPFSTQQLGGRDPQDILHGFLTQYSGRSLDRFQYPRVQWTVGWEIAPYQALRAHPFVVFLSSWWCFPGPC